ncbi:MAG TPA: hypothetical protein VKE70_13435 [Candidatus Solibacter sp.]|nr:hypothetical protein [Candidatus Solibacter sp.]
MPAMCGAQIRLEYAPGLRDRRGPVHAGAFLRERRIAFDCTRAEFPRILAHEVAHFVWIRLGNAARRSWEEVLCRESGAGELGWSAEWRKAALDARDRGARTRRWREYCCEAFCDTAAWLWSGVARHDEFTLARRWRETRRRWFASNVEDRTLSI